MEIFFNFNKAFISSKVITFLEENITNDEDKKSLAKLKGNKKLPYKEANSLLQSILRAIVIEDGEEEVPINECTQTKVGGDDTVMDEPSTGLAPIPSGSGTQNPTQNSRVQNEDKVNQGKSKNDKEKSNICHFYKNGKCKHGKDGQDCRFEHPNICKKILYNGLKKFNSKGCDSNCAEFHPNACRDSLSQKACSRNECRFFHLKGTKKMDWREMERKKETGRYQKEKRPEMQETETRNRFEAFSSPPQQRKLVFQQDQMSLTLANIMKELADIKIWQAKHTESEGEKSSSQNWRTQDQRRAWDSQRRDSQYSPRH